MSNRHLDELEKSVNALNDTPTYRRGQLADACFRQLMAVLRDFDRRLSELGLDPDRALES